MENYEKIKILGKGSFGSVHLVQDDKSKEVFIFRLLLLFIQFQLKISNSFLP